MRRCKIRISTWPWSGFILLRLRRGFRRSIAMNLSFPTMPISSPTDKYWCVSWHVFKIRRFSEKWFKFDENTLILMHFYQNRRIFKTGHEMHQYLSVGDGIGVVGKLRFVAIDRRKPHLKRSNINPFHGHIEIRILHLIIGVSYHRSDRMHDLRL